MSYDLAINQYNDFVFAASGDLLHIDGTPLHEQRIRVRLKIRRGSWVFDEAKELGSRLDTVLNRSSNEAMTRIDPLVREALSGAEDLQITHVDVVAPDDPRASMLTVIVGYVPVATEMQSEVVPADEEQIQEATIEFQA